MNKRKIIALGAGTFALLSGATARAQIAFDPASNLPVGQLPDTAVLSDLDGDGDVDLAVTTDNLDKVEVLLNNGAAVFGAPMSTLTGAGTGPGAMIARDFNGDGSNDLAVALQNTNAVRLLVNNGSGAFTRGGSTGVGLGPRHMAAADLDLDGDMDLVTSNRDSNNMTVLLNNGAGVFTAMGPFSVGTDPRGVTLADFNGDGLPDAAVSANDTRNVDVLINLGGGSFSAPTSQSVGRNLRPDGVTAIDIENDGDMDIAAATSGTGLNFVTVFTNTAGVFGTGINYAVGGVNPGAILAADLDADGDMDLAVANQDSLEVSALANNGSGVFGAPSLFAVGANPGSIAAADLDASGSLDLATANRDSNNVSILINQGTGAVLAPFCLSDSSGTPCPCGNYGLGGNGCENSSSTGGVKLAVANYTPNGMGGGTANLLGTGFPPLAHPTVVAIRSTVQENGSFGSVFGDGLLCLHAPVVRITSGAASGGSLNLPISHGAGAGRFHYQLWYRNTPAPFCTAAAFNLSSGFSVLWP